MRSARSIAPSAARLTESLRDIGYDFPAAVADIVDNSISAGAEHVSIEIVFEGSDSYVLIADDGEGMSANGLMEALRFGSRRSYHANDLGRYGLGLKTASLSQARSLTVLTRRKGGTYISTRMLDLDLVQEHDDWLIVDPVGQERVLAARVHVGADGGTVVLWRNLDRLLPERHPDGGWARRRVETAVRRTREHLSMVFHRFLAGEAGERALVISLNGEKLQPWDPFARAEPATQELPSRSFELVVGDTSGMVRLSRYILPSRDAFSGPGGFEALSGPRKWNRQQGLYIYRADRLVQWGGWAGIRAIDEHTKLGRAALEFDTALDTVFHINVAKMRVSVPPQLRQILEQPIHELAIRADDAYRKTAKRAEGKRSADRPATATRSVIGLGLRSAAIQAGQYEALKSILDVLRQSSPELLQEMGLD